MAPPRQNGLGGQGVDRFREGLGAGTSGGSPAQPMRGAISGGTSDVLEDALFGQGRPGGPVTPPPPGPTTGWAFPASSRVYAYQYDYGMQQLRVKFIKYGTPWVYNDVPTTVFQAFDASPSKGSYINSTLNYMDYRRANPQETAQYFSGI